MNWKVTLLLLVAVFAPAIATATVNLNPPELKHSSTLAKTGLRIVCEPTGDPIDGPHGPH